MKPYTVLISPSPTSTRVLLTSGPDELMRAYLPPPSQVRHERAMPTLLEGLSLLFDTAVRVVLSVDERGAAWCLGLTDAIGMGLPSLYYELEVVSSPVRRRRGKRIRGVANFADLRSLRLLTSAGGEL